MSLKCILQGQDSKNLATKEELNQHIENKSNPHEVTAQQVGAIKFTSRYVAGTEEEIDNVLETMISAGLPGDTLFGEMVISTNDLSLLDGGWSIRLHRGNNGYADVIATLMSNDIIRIKTRVKYQGAWMPWRELANDYSIANALEKKAPNGYGLGSETAKTITNWDDAKENGFYKGPAPRGIGNGVIMGVTFSYGPLYKVQIVYPNAHANCSAQREMPANGTWGTWEWVNPPMELGVEYRTTERYFGKPVYTKVIDFGTSPNSNIKNVYLGISDIDKICGASFHYYIPSTGENGVIVSHINHIGLLVSDNVIQIITNTDRTNTKFYVTIKYTKTTD